MLHAVVPKRGHAIVLHSNVRAVDVGGIVVVAHKTGAEIVGPGDTVDGYYVLARDNRLVLVLPGFGSTGTVSQEPLNMDATYYIGCHRLAKQRGVEATAVLNTRNSRFKDLPACSRIKSAAMARDVWFALAGTTGVAGLAKLRASSSQWKPRGLCMTQDGASRPVTQLAAFGIRASDRALPVGNHWLHQGGPTPVATLEHPFTVGGRETEEEAWRRAVAAVAPRATGAATVDQAAGSNTRTLLKTIVDIPMLYEIRRKAAHRTPKLFEPANRKPLIKLVEWTKQKIERQVKKIQYFGLKFDGIRISLHVKNGEARLYSKRGTNITKIHARSFVTGGFAYNGYVLKAPKTLGDCILDGEYIRVTETVRLTIEGRSEDVPARTRHNANRSSGVPRFAVYDCVTDGDYTTRKETLAEIVKNAGDFFYIAEYKPKAAIEAYTAALLNLARELESSDQVDASDHEEDDAPSDDQAQREDQEEDLIAADEDQEEDLIAAEEDQEVDPVAAKENLEEDLIAAEMARAARTAADEAKEKELAVDDDLVADDSEDAEDRPLTVQKAKELVMATKGLFEGIVFKTNDSGYNTATFYKAKPHYIEPEPVCLVLLGHYSVNNADTATADRYVFGTAAETAGASRAYPWKGYVPVFEFAAFGSNGLAAAVRLKCEAARYAMRPYTATGRERNTVVGRMTKVVVTPDIFVSFNPDRIYRLSVPASIRKWSPVKVYLHAADGGSLDEGKTAKDLTPLDTINGRGVRQ